MMKAAVLALFLGIVTLVDAQQFPSHPVKIVIGFTPGGGVDINARLLANRLTDILGQPVVVENKPGAGTNIGAEFVAKSAPDGYTLFFNSPAMAINMSLYKNPGYDIQKDFVPISVFADSTNILVVPSSLPVKTPKELVALARDKPGTLNFSSAGSGSTQHLAGELFKLRTGTQMVHVPYRGSAPSVAALLTGEVQLSFVNPLAIGPHVKSGRLRALAVAGPKRAALLPDVPTMKEAGVEGIEVPLWFGLLAPRGTPREIIAVLAAGVARAAKDPEVRKRLEEQGGEPVGSTPEEFAALLREEVAKWAEVVKVSGAKAE
jgi:tripartite-type tricarboxylate transporter receptor subunit TctC